jgi:NADP-dependent 3-hydroxy acid dehydrogenase YdfG
LNTSEESTASEDSPGILVTGAGSGFGADMARRFASDGYRVAVTDISEQRAQTVLDQIKSAGADGFALKMDVCRDTDWQLAFDRVLSEWGSLEVLVNNAGVAAAGRLEDTTLEDWQWVTEIDLMGVVRGCHRFLPLMRQQNKGHIVNIASFAGLAGAPGINAYGVAKAGVVALSEQLRAELADSRVGVSVVCPAFVKTNLLETFRSTDTSARARVQGWMERSEVTSEMVAQQVYEAVRANHFMVLTHSQTRWAWRFKRWFPERYFRRLVKQGSLTRQEGGT